MDVLIAILDVIAAVANVLIVNYDLVFLFASVAFISWLVWVVVGEA